MRARFQACFGLPEDFYRFLRVEWGSIYGVHTTRRLLKAYLGLAVFLEGFGVYNFFRGTNRQQQQQQQKQDGPDDLPEVRPLRSGLNNSDSAVILGIESGWYFHEKLPDSGHRYLFALNHFQA